MSRIRTFFDISVGDSPSSRVVFELFKAEVPKTVENFRALCTGEKGLSEISGKELWYKGSPIHRIIPGFMVQGGDFTQGSGKGGESIYGSPFADEDLVTPVDKAGLLVMANRGPDTNSSQFFITLEPAPHLTGKHTVFGRVVTGIQTIQDLALIETDNKDRPLRPVVVVNSGELVKKSAVAPAAAAAPVKERKPSLSPSPSTSRSPPPKRRRSTPPPSNSDDSDSDSEEDRRRRRQAKKDKKESRRREKESKRGKSGLKVGGGKGKGFEEAVETEAELDARLEREEKERLEEERKLKLVQMKKQLEEEKLRQKAAGGVVYKGRGAMRYLDPESTQHRPRSSPYQHPSTYTNRSDRQAAPHMRDPDAALKKMMGGGGGSNSRGDERGPRGGQDRSTFRPRSKSPERWGHRQRSRTPPARRPGLGAAAGGGRGEDRSRSRSRSRSPIEVRGLGGRGERRGSRSESEGVEMEMDD